MIKKFTFAVTLMASALGTAQAAPSASQTKTCAANYQAAARVLAFKSSSMDASQSAASSAMLKTAAAYSIRAQQLVGASSMETLPKAVVVASDKIRKVVMTGDDKATMKMTNAIFTCDKSLGLETIGL